VSPNKAKLELGIPKLKLKPQTSPAKLPQATVLGRPMLEHDLVKFGKP